MFKNQWYAVEHGSLITDAPHAVKLCSQDLVIYRSAGKLVAQADVCPHRGASLALGRVVEGCIQCPYHGWKFDASGVCTEIPANPPGTPITKKARIDSYPVAEKYGFVWVFLGDDQSGDAFIPELPYLDDVAAASKAGYRAVIGDFTWNANWERVLENAVDIAHTPFVHYTSFGNRDKPEIEDFAIEGNPGHSAIATVNLEPPPPKGIWGVFMKNKERPPVKTRTGLFFPNVSLLEVNLSIGQMLIYTAAVPVDEHTTISKFIMLRSFFTGGWADKDSIKRTMKIFLEDKDTVESQKPRLVPADINAELHVKSDAVQLAFRRWRVAQTEAGNRLAFWEPKTKVSLVSSPSRRADASQQWVFGEREAVVCSGSKAEPHSGKDQSHDQSHEHSQDDVADIADGSNAQASPTDGNRVPVAGQ
jgi:phenylpropionate dioxygenase-like ring-hydroxylating dioxygenase large terminal subunit